MKNKKEFIAFGASNLLGDLIDILHLNDAILVKVVLNIPEVLSGNRMPLAIRLARLPYPVIVERLEEFEPREGQLYFIGFKGSQMIPLRQQLKTTFSIQFANLIHPTAILSPTLTLGEGCVIGAGVIIGSHTTLGNHVVINRGATIGHDVWIEDYTFLGPSSVLCSEVRLREGAQVFAGATVIEGVEIGARAQIAAGAVCIHDVPEEMLVAGVPAVVKKRLTPGHLTDHLAH